MSNIVSIPGVEEKRDMLKLRLALHVAKRLSEEFSKVYESTRNYSDNGKGVKIPNIHPSMIKGEYPKGLVGDGWKDVEKSLIYCLDVDIDHFLRMGQSFQFRSVTCRDFDSGGTFCDDTRELIFKEVSVRRRFSSLLRGAGTPEDVSIFDGLKYPEILNKCLEDMTYGRYRD